MPRRFDSEVKARAVRLVAEHKAESGGRGEGSFETEYSVPVAEALLGPHVAGERTQATKVATLDHRTFRPIRTRHAEALTLLPETPLQSRAPHYEQARQTGRDFLGCQVLEQLAQSEVQHRTAADIGLTTKAAAGFQRRDQCSDAAR